jgi:hypothetical protein
MEIHACAAAEGEGERPRQPRDPQASQLDHDRQLISQNGGILATKREASGERPAGFRFLESIKTAHYRLFLT